MNGVNINTDLELIIEFFNYIVLHPLGSKDIGAQNHRGDDEQDPKTF